MEGGRRIDSSSVAPGKRRRGAGGGRRVTPVRRATSSPSAAPAGRWLPSLKLVLVGLVLIGLGALVGIALTRELNTGAAVAPRAAVLPTPRPALSAAEESYVQALWPVHSEVKAAALKMTLGGIDYKLQEMDRAAFRQRIERSLAVYRQAERQLQALQPPLSLQQYHTGYLEAVNLYTASAVEMLKLADDGQEQHLIDAFPLSREAGQRVWEIGLALWPGEYVPS
jgi:hypothetical protein